jgi:addiction module HigA family antidote
LTSPVYIDKDTKAPGRWQLLITTNRKEKTNGTNTHSSWRDPQRRVGRDRPHGKKLADVIEVPPNRLYRLLAGKQNVTAGTALRLSQYFGMSADFWMNLQSAYELDLARQQTGKAIQKIPRRSQTVEPRAPVA